MQQIIYLILGLIVGYLLGKKQWQDSRSRGSGDGAREIINPRQVKERQDHLRKVLEMARQKGEIANDDVEKALGVSNATAERYLNELEHEGKLTQVGEHGKYVKYRAV